MESLEMFRRALLQVDEVLGIVDHDQLPLPSGDMPLDVQELIRERQALRNRKKFQAADELRERMERQGYMLEDGPLGTAVFFRPGKG
jgi:cysteinyl-tRNA synthetase